MPVIDGVSSLRKTFAPRWSAGAAFAVSLVCVVSAEPAAAAGRWKFEGYSLVPKQETLSQVKPSPGHIYEKRISWAFEVGEKSFGTIELFFTDTDADKVVYLGTCTVTFHLEGPVASGQPGTLPVVGMLAAEGNAKSKANGGRCFGAILPETALGAEASAKGAVVVPKAAPGATMTIHVSGNLSHGHGAHNGTLHAQFRWVDE